MNFEPYEEALAIDAYKTWLRLFELPKYYELAEKRLFACRPTNRQPPPERHVVQSGGRHAVWRGRMEFHETQRVSLVERRPRLPL